MTKSILLLLLSICVQVSPVSAVDDDPPRKPNIVYINADDLGYTDLSCYAKDHLKKTYYETPNLDRLAASGVRFTNGYAASANCAPSRACVMTGHWPQRHGVFTVGSSERGKAKDRKLIPVENAKFLKAKHLLLPEALKKIGYTTAHFGKWHITKDDPTNHGFDFNFGGFKDGSPTKGGYHSPYDYPNVVCDKKGEYLTDRLAVEAVDFIERQKDKPFFINFATYTVHTPIQPKTALQEKYKQKAKTKTHNNADYAAMVQSLDEAVGNIIGALTKHQLLENTLIVFTSDNGGHDGITDNFPLRAGKGSYYEGGIREPFIFSWQGKIAPQQINRTPVTNLDLFPTFLATTNSAITESFDGVNLLPLLLADKKSDWRESTAGKSLAYRALFWHFPIYLQAYKKNDRETRDPLFRTRPGSVIRSGDWKLHHYFEDNSVELYNLKDDLSEKHNLASSQPNKSKELLGLLNDWRKKTNAPAPTKINPAFKNPK